MISAEAVNWAIALLPVLLLLGAFAWLDVFHLMSPGELLRLLSLGALACVLVYPIAGRLIDTLPLGFSGYSRFVAPWLEEAMKGAMLVYLVVRNRIGYKIDAALSGFAIGAGFSLVENIIYLMRFPHLDAGVWLVRGLGTAVMHGGTVAILASLSHELIERDLLGRAGSWRLHPARFLPGYLIAVAAHTGFNQFPDRPLIAMLLSILLVPSALVAIFSRGTGEARNWLTTQHTQHRADLETLRSGILPETESGRLIGDFAVQVDDPAIAGTILRYWALLAEIVTNAERAMIERAAGHRLDRDREADRERLAELATLEHRLGRPILTRLERLLPFSRNDLWEVAELREQLHRR